MQYPRVIVFESDGRLASALRPVTEANAWSLREPRQGSALLRLVERGGPAVVVLRAGRDLEREMLLLDRITAEPSDIDVVVVTENEHLHLIELAWSLGATYVLHPSKTHELLGEIVVRLLSNRK